ncbi:hypothetical protein BGZ80_004387 [Entomortierella chlamydospora]|uniref:F-box domain protein n=1 Tax=Entomortierella chlamydospora TaxID=101097 RepID=A0A9P6N1E5_9FUNG|nr:hypothetical protein BGZ79_006817 [Entomortierella chlamydospora]KAG0020335.1 hypothetical protein BGZ80_004387 [Entomortierella chlamydospora]
MLISSSRNLKSYSMKSDQIMGPLSVKALLDDQRCFTLEQLDFKQCVAIKSKHIQLILTSCPNLKTFRALSGQDQQNSFDPRLDIRDLPIHSTKGPQWACQGLLELQIGFTGFSEITNDLPVQPYVDYIYDQLAVLTELQTLYLGGELGAAFFPDDSRVWAFDFTLRSGIWKLGTLKQLKYLNVQRLKHNRIGKPEVEWVVRHWPHLTEFHGQRKWQQ